MIRMCFEYVPVALWGLMLLTIVRPLKLSRRMNIVASVLLLAASQKFLIFRFFGGNSFVPDLPQWFIIFEGWAYSSVMILFLFSVMWAVASIIRRLMKCRGSVSLSRKVMSVLAVCAVAIATWGIWEGVRVPTVRQVVIESKDLPQELNGMKFIHMTDLHCSPAARRNRMARIMECVRSRQPDFVCITGDFVDGSPEQRAKDLEPLAELKPIKVFGCAGNHEYYSDYAAWRTIFESYGVTMLDNAHRVIDFKHGKVVVGGVSDLAAGRFGFEPTNVRKAFDGAPSGTFRILLQHRPLWPQVNAEYGVNLQLSGHTHGGAILGFDRFVARMGNHGFVRGLYKVGRMLVYVGPGSGQWAGFPLRLGVPSEITEFIVHSS